jgi:hypothetical protein
MKCCLVPGTMLLLLGCTHTDSFVNSPPVVGPHSAGNDVQLTFNIEQDYWPTWTQDGHGILYSFVAPCSKARHRCIGLLPAAGGTRNWELCDNRATQGDSVSSYTAYALASDGRLLYATAVSDSGIGGHAPSTNTLWLADTAAPFQRTAMLSLPTILSGVSYSWISDLAWTGPTSFIALMQDFSISEEPQPPCEFVQDSIFMRVGAVVAGTIAAGHAELQLVNGTTGATGYSLAENGTSVVFTTWNDQHLFKTPITGGPVTTLSPALGGPGAQILGVSCKGSTCLVASDAVTLINVPGGAPARCAVVNSGAKDLYAVAIGTGSSERVATAAGIIVLPKISPESGDAVIQVGGSFGHLQTIRTPSNAELHLLRAALP